MKTKVGRKNTLQWVIFGFLLGLLAVNIYSGFLYDELTETSLTLFFLVYFLVDMRKMNKILVIALIFVVIGKNVMQIFYDRVSSRLRIYEK